MQFKLHVVKPAHAFKIHIFHRLKDLKVGSKDMWPDYFFSLCGKLFQLLGMSAFEKIT